jgi:PAS domain S-box-containing protein
MRTTKKKIFVVDDEESNLKYFKRIFNKEYKVITTDDSASSFPIIRSLMPDIVLLDIYMPEVNGFDLCKKLQADEKTKTIPIIFISSLCESKQIEEGLNLGAVDFIQKPINKTETLARIRTHLKVNQLQKDLAVTNSKLERLLKEKSKKLDEEQNQKNQLQKNLYESESKFQIIFKSAPEAIIIVSAESGEIVDVNPAGCNLFDYTYDELIGVNQTELLQPSDRKIKQNYIRTHEDNNKVFGVRMQLNTLVKKNGTKIPVNNSSRTILYEGELFILGVIFDLSKQKKIEEELRKSKKHADELNRLKGFFLSNMSHELRTPLVGMLGFSNILEEELKDTHLKYMASAITTSGNRLLNTLKVLMDYSLLEGNNFISEWKKVNLNDIVAEVLQSYKTQSKEKDLEIIIKIPRNKIETIADEHFIKEVISQLINNAFAYTQSGSISIFLETKSINGKVFAVLSIKDTGIGINKEKLDLIFDDFRQVSEGCTRDYQGLGLGLALAKKIVDLHNGEITVESKENEGSLFQLKLIAEKASQIN